MITVSIAINGKAIFTRSAIRAAMSKEGIGTYQVDDGVVLKHAYNDGAIPLAIAMLKNIKEIKTGG